MRSKSAGWFTFGFCLALILAAGAISPGTAAPPKPAKSKSITEGVVKSDAPIHISADRMEVRQNDRTILFEGNVVVKQDDAVISGNRLKVYGLAAEKKKGGPAPAKNAGASDKIDYIEVEGNVRVTQQDRVATADKAIFYQQEQKVILRGHPTVTRGKDKLEGSVITIFLKEGRSLVEGGKDIPVQAILFPEKKE